MYEINALPVYMIILVHVHYSILLFSWHFKIFSTFANIHLILIIYNIVFFNKDDYILNGKEIFASS